MSKSKQSTLYLIQNIELLQPAMPPKRNFSKPKRCFTNNKTTANSDKRVEIYCLLINISSVGIQIPYRTISSDYELKQLIKSSGASWSHQQRIWKISKQNYYCNIQAILSYCKEKGYFLNSIPNFVLSAEKQMPLEICVKIHGYANPTLIRYSQLELCIEPESLPFYDRLYGFQRESLSFGIQKHGRLLLADEMGVGKTIQSLAIAFIFRHEWPLLIVCPSTLRYNWQNQILNWYGNEVKKSEVQVYNKGGTTLREGARILIVSYELAWKYKQLLQDFKVAIADEAHFLKNSGSKRSDILVPLLAEKRRIILLTGTPAFARPRQIYNLASIIRPDVFHNFREFGNRYCDPQRNPWSGTIEYNGCKNSKQLFYILKDKVMMRRLKREVLNELPDKQRQKVVIQTNKNICKQINNLINDSSGASKNAEDLIMEMFGSKSQQSPEHRDKIMEAYRLTGTAKVDGVIEYILSLLENQVKLLIFAHHRVMLDSIQEVLTQKKFRFMRIDGEVDPMERQVRVNMFQTDDGIKAALLSISAAGVGITLTESNTVVFAELHWTPGMLIQAEDRAHRIGQKNCVNCHYLIGENTLDNILYSYLLKKITNVSSFVDGEQSKLEIEEMAKGQMGKVSKREITQHSPNHRSSHNPKFQSIKQVRKIQIEVKCEEESQWTDISSDRCEEPAPSLCSRKNMIRLTELECDEDLEHAHAFPQTAKNGYRSSVSPMKQSPQKIETILSDIFCQDLPKSTTESPLSSRQRVQTQQDYFKP